MKTRWVGIAALAAGALVCAGQAGAQNPFFSPPMYTGGGQTITSDINGDGKPELVTADGTVLVNNGDGTITTGTSLWVTGNAIAVGDKPGRALRFVGWGGVAVVAEEAGAGAVGVHQAGNQDS
jgi:hypothetical protein